MVHLSLILLLTLLLLLLLPPTQAALESFEAAHVVTPLQDINTPVRAPMTQRLQHMHSCA